MRFHLSPRTPRRFSAAEFNPSDGIATGPSSSGGAPGAEITSAPFSLTRVAPLRSAWSTLNSASSWAATYQVPGVSLSGTPRSPLQVSDAPAASPVLASQNQPE